MAKEAVSFAPVHLVRAMDREMAAAGAHGALLQTADDAVYRGRTVRLGGKELLNFGCCSYLGLELHPALQEGAIEAIRHYGTQFPFPRAMLQNPLYAELEALLERMTGGYPMIAASTSLAHISAIPVLIGKKDAVVIDMLAHASVHTAVALLRDVPIVQLRHSDVEALEDELKRLGPQHDKIWYLLDGLYSMRGDFAPIDELMQLVDRYPALHLYIDDAHSMTWTGTHGRGYALERIRDRSRVVVALSLNKAFAAGGGALIFPTREQAALVRRSGGPMVFSGAVQPPLLGAAVASAKVHLSPELPRLQKELANRLSLVLSLAQALDVPLGAHSVNPVFFLRAGSSANCFQLVQSLRERGACVCAAMFPIVPRGHAGIRFTITLHNSEDDIRTMMGWLEAESRRLSGSGTVVVAKTEL